MCGLRTNNEFNASYRLTDSDGDDITVTSMVTATSTHGATASRKGDSGGPVFVFDADGRRVSARGVVSGGRLTTTLLFQDFQTIAADFGVTPIIGTPWPTG
ncbi:hypothetical protein ACFY36_14635 [Actinoplanes sp. NPDC000266]